MSNVFHIKIGFVQRSSFGANHPDRKNTHRRHDSFYRPEHQSCQSRYKMTHTPPTMRPKLVLRVPWHSVPAYRKATRNPRFYVHAKMVTRRTQNIGTRRPGVGEIRLFCVTADEIAHTHAPDMAFSERLGFGIGRLHKAAWALAIVCHYVKRW